MIIQERKVAPNFNLSASNGQEVSLKDYKGKKNVVLYFYPKDDTPGCTTQACGFRDEIKAIEKKDTIVLGVSPDKISKHEKFIAKHDLPFLLLSDEEKKVCELYGVWVEKSMYGRKYMGVARTTFVIDMKGKVVKIFEKVKPKVHSGQIVECLNTLRE